MPSGPLFDEPWSADSTWPREVRVLPDGGADLVWTGRALIVAGPDSRARLVQSAVAGDACGVRFVPGAARSAFGWTGEQLLDVAVPAEVVLGPRAAAELTSRLLHATREARPGLRRAGAAEHPRRVDIRVPAVTEAVRVLANDPALPVSTLAARIGYSERQLRRLVRSEVGYSPKLLARILRLRRTLSAADADRSLLVADLAAIGGYVDQAHLSQDVRALTGVTPTALLRR
jgi:AraC-like DNA-binding protein